MCLRSATVWGLDPGSRLQVTPELLEIPSPCLQATWGVQASLPWAPGCPHIWADFQTLGVATAVPAWAGFPGWPGGGQRWPSPPARWARIQLILRGRCLDKMRWEPWKLQAAHIWLGFALYVSVPLSSALPLLSRNRVSASGQRDLGAEEVKVPGRDGLLPAPASPFLRPLPGGLFPSSPSTSLFFPRPGPEEAPSQGDALRGGAGRAQRPRGGRRLEVGGPAGTRRCLGSFWGSSLVARAEQSRYLSCGAGEGPGGRGPGGGCGKEAERAGVAGRSPCPFLLLPSVAEVPCRASLGLPCDLGAGALWQRDAVRNNRISLLPCVLWGAYLASLFSGAFLRA